MAVLPHEGTYPVMYGTFSVPVGTGYRRGYLARPDKAGAFPVVLMLPDVDGLGSPEKDLARRMARNGLATLAVDIYEERPRSREEGLALYATLSDRQVLRLVDEAFEFLSSDDIDWAHTSRIGLLGLEVGGRFALLKAATHPWVGSVCVLSTPLVGDEERTRPVMPVLEHISVPVLGLYGDSDPDIPPEVVDEAQTRNAHGQWLLYQEAGHGFYDVDSPDYHPGAAEDAVARLISFFQQTLPPPQSEDLG